MEKNDENVYKVYDVKKTRKWEASSYRMVRVGDMNLIIEKNEYSWIWLQRFG